MLHFAERNALVDGSQHIAVADYEHIIGTAQAFKFLAAEAVVIHAFEIGLQPENLHTEVLLLVAIFGEGVADVNLAVDEEIVGLSLGHVKDAIAHEYADGILALGCQHRFHHLGNIGVGTASTGFLEAFRIHVADETLQRTVVGYHLRIDEVQLWLAVGISGKTAHIAVNGVLQL